MLLVYSSLVRHSPLRLTTHGEKLPRSLPRQRNSGVVLRRRGSVVRASLAVQPERRKRASDCYAILGLTAQAGADEIRQAYRRLARIYHPDTNSSEDTVPKFLEVHEAYKIALRRQERAQAKALLESQSPQKNSRPLKTAGKPRRREDWDDIWDDILGSTTQRKTPKRQ